MALRLLRQLTGWARSLKRDVIALWIAARDVRTPRLAKIVAGIVAAYALSPIDLIPDFVPVLGYLDDLILVPIGIRLVIRLIPGSLMDEFRAQAAHRLEAPRSRAGVFVIAFIWTAAVGAFAYWLLAS